MTVSEQIIQVIDTLCEKFGVAINWTSQNVIPYIEVLCKKLVNYELVTSIAWTVFAILISVAFVIICRVWYNKVLCRDKEFCEKRGIKPDNRLDWEDHVGLMVFIGFTIFVCVVSGFVLIKQIGDIIKCITFPEMYVFEYIKGLIGN